MTCQVLITSRNGDLMASLGNFFNVCPHIILLPLSIRPEFSLLALIFVPLLCTTKKTAIVSKLYFLLSSSCINALQVLVWDGRDRSIQRKSFYGIEGQAHSLNIIHELLGLVKSFMFIVRSWCCLKASVALFQIRSIIIPIIPICSLPDPMSATDRRICAVVSKQSSLLKLFILGKDVIRPTRTGLFLRDTQLRDLERLCV